MLPQRKIRVKCLKREEAWELFKETAGDKVINSDPDIPELARNIVKVCIGLPLFLITIGHIIFDERNPEEWRKASDQLEKSALEFPGMRSEVFLVLNFHRRISYHQKLKNVCLLESVHDEYTEVKIHSVHRNLAKWIACDCGKQNDNFLVQVRAGLIEVSNVDKWKKAEKISLMDNNIRELTEQPKCPNVLGWVVEEGNNQFPSSLEKISLLDLPKLDTIQVEGMPNLCFHNLCFVHIDCCDALKHLTWFGSVQCLQTLHLMEIEVICDDVVAVGQESKTFSKLKYIRFHALPELRSIYHNALPFPLEIMEILKCPKLKKLPLNSNIINNNLKWLKGEQSWWNELEREDETRKSFLFSCFEVPGSL
ncbi:hypothetical protein HHK36_022417 [Tetracentron sinense]|uniref:NB-ARC domain-containing protein n=1 Tax=Tetracentron sinense TaxID=13715 RepID=A0A834YUW2_TETSI|nr:hypothetical protein HHK36_022417 [Tetracentron sinense]